MGTFFDFYRHTNPTYVAFHLYDSTHFAVLGVIALVILAAVLLYKKITPPKRGFYLKVLAGIIFTVEFTRQLSFPLAQGWFSVNYLPLHLCNIMLIFCIWFAWRRKQMAGDVPYGVGLPGFLAALVFPDWTMFPIFNFYGLNSWVIHTLLIIFILCPLATGEIVPNPKNILRIFGIVVLMAIPIYLFNLVFDTNYLFLNAGSEGSPIEVFILLFGETWFVIPLALFAFGVVQLMYLPWRKRQFGLVQNDSLPRRNV